MQPSAFEYDFGSGWPARLDSEDARVSAHHPLRQRHIAFLSFLASFLGFLALGPSLVSCQAQINDLNRMRCHAAHFLALTGKWARGGKLECRRCVGVCESSQGPVEGNSGRLARLCSRSECKEKWWLLPKQSRLGDALLAFSTFGLWPFCDFISSGCSACRRKGSKADAVPKILSTSTPLGVDIRVESNCECLASLVWNKFSTNLVFSCIRLHSGRKLRFSCSTRHSATLSPTLL